MSRARSAVPGIPANRLNGHDRASTPRLGLELRPNTDACFPLGKRSCRQNLVLHSCVSSLYSGARSVQSLPSNAGGSNRGRLGEIQFNGLSPMIAVAGRRFFFQNRSTLGYLLHDPPSPSCKEDGRKVKRRNTVSARRGKRTSKRAKKTREGGPVFGGVPRHRPFNDRSTREGNMGRDCWRRYSVWPERKRSRKSENAIACGGPNDA